MSNVRDFGAVGDGLANDTKSVQAAIEAGGVTRFTPGTYRCGTLYLRDFTTLELEPGAVLLASSSPEDYNADDFAPYNHACPAEAVSGAHFIIAVGCRNITIRGGGRIDGNREGFYALPADPFSVCSYETITWRPAQMLFIHSCRNVTMTDVELTNSPYWNSFFYDCEQVQLRGLRITNPMATPNGDGLDIEACRKVTVSDCIIETGDDCIALRSSSEFGTEHPVCENITISNCILTTVCNAVRIGVGEGIVRNVLMTNCTIIGSRTGLCLVTHYLQDASLQIEDCIFSNLNIEAKRPFSLHSNAWGRCLGGPVTKQLKNLMFQNIFGTVSAGSIIDAFAPGDISDIVFDNVELRWTGKAPEGVYEAADYDFTESTEHIPPCAWLIRNGQSITLKDCQVVYEQTPPEGFETDIRIKLK